jgi:Protein of Unknown function (DUF2784)
LNIYSILASIVLAAHVVFIGWVIFGAAWTRFRPWLRAIHMAVLGWSIVVEVGPWPCPLTVAENWFEMKAGVPGYTNGFMLHYLDKLVYPDIPPLALTVAALIVVGINAGVYLRRFRRRQAYAGW